MSGDEGDKETQLTPVALQEMVSKAIESAISSFSGRIMKAVDDKLSEAQTANLGVKASKLNSEKTDTTIPPSSGTGILPKTNVSLPTGGGGLIDAALWSGVKTMASSAALGAGSSTLTMSVANH